MEGVDPRTYDAFLHQLEALDEFLARRFDDGYLRLGPDDPDVRRLLEAMAYCTARTQLAARGAMAATIRRMAADDLDELAAPAPAAGLLEMLPTKRLVAPLTIPRGTLIRVENPNAPGDRRESRVSFFSTLDAVTLLPLSVQSVALVPPTQPRCVEVRLLVGCEHKEGFELALHVRRLGDYRASSGLFAALRRAVKAATVSFAEAEPARVPIAFGAADDERPPLARVRDFLHAPEQTLFVRVRIPPVPRGGGAVCVRFELDDSWPDDLRVETDSLRPFVVPIQNVWSDLAAPLHHDGTVDAHPLRIGAAREAAELVRVTGVYESGKSLRPVTPMALGLARHGYELLRTPENAPVLRLRLPHALEAPVRVTVDAVWSQPSLWDAPPGPLRVSFQQRAVAADLRLLGLVRRPARSPLSEEPERMLDVLAARTRRALTRADLVGLLELAGASGDSPYRGIPAFIDGVEVEDVPDAALGPGGTVREHRVRWRAVDPDTAPLVRELGAWAELLLDALSESPVRVVSTLPVTGGDR